MYNRFLEFLSFKNCLIGLYIIHLASYYIKQALFLRHGGESDSAVKSRS